MIRPSGDLLWDNYLQNDRKSPSLEPTSPTISASIAWSGGVAWLAGFLDKESDVTLDRDTNEKAAATYFDTLDLTPFQRSQISFLQSVFSLRRC